MSKNFDWSNFTKADYAEMQENLRKLEEIIPENLSQLADEAYDQLNHVCQDMFTKENGESRYAVKCFDDLTYSPIVADPYFFLGDAILDNNNVFPDIADKRGNWGYWADTLPGDAEDEIHTAGLKSQDILKWDYKEFQHAVEKGMTSLVEKIMTNDDGLYRDDFCKQHPGVARAMEQKQASR